MSWNDFLDEEVFKRVWLESWFNHSCDDVISRAIRERWITNSDFNSIEFDIWISKKMNKSILEAVNAWWIWFIDMFFKNELWQELWLTPTEVWDKHSKNLWNAVWMISNFLPIGKLKYSWKIVKTLIWSWIKSWIKQKIVLRDIFVDTSIKIATDEFIDIDEPWKTLLNTGTQIIIKWKLPKPKDIIIDKTADTIIDSIWDNFF